MTTTKSVLVLMLGLSAPPTAALTAQVREQTVYYEISGHTAAELRRQLQNKGPAGTNGMQFHGRTEGYIEWSFLIEAHQGTCRLGNLAIVLDVTITLPHWTERDGAPQALVRLWENHLATLTLHEAGHRDLALEAHRAMQDVLAAIPPTTDCKAFRRSADRAFQRILRRLQRDNRRYDLRTGYGRKQGAVIDNDGGE